MFYTPKITNPEEGLDAIPVTADKPQNGRLNISPLCLASIN